MSNSDLAGEFHVLMRSIYDRAKAECGYIATRFKKMLAGRKAISWIEDRNYISSEFNGIGWPHGVRVACALYLGQSLQN